MQRVWKGLLAGMLACLLLAGSCWAAPELAGLSDEELNALLKSVQGELARRAENPVPYMTNEELNALLEELTALQQQRTEAAHQQYLADLEARYAGSGIHKLSEMEDVFLGVEHIETGARICLGMPLAELKALLGEPDDASSTFSFYKGLGLNVDVDENENIKGININSFGEGPPKIKLFNGITAFDFAATLIYSFDNVITVNNQYKEQLILLHKTEGGKYITLDSLDDATATDAILAWDWSPVTVRDTRPIDHISLYYWDDYAQAVYPPEVTDSTP